MAGQSSEGKVKMEEEVECVLDPKRSRYLRRRGSGLDGT
jgi:hypothetical protein